MAGRYFKLNAAAIRLLRHWSLGQPEQVLAAANQEAGLPLSDSDLANLLHFLRIHDLIAATDTEQRRSYPLAAARRTSLLKQILHQYLFFRIPLGALSLFLTEAGLGCVVAAASSYAGCCQCCCSAVLFSGQPRLAPLPQLFFLSF